MTWRELRAAEREVGPVDRRRARVEASEELDLLRGVFRRPVSDEELEQCFEEAGL